MLLLFPYIKPYAHTIWALLIGLLLEAGFESGLRLSFKFLIDQAILPKDYSRLINILSLLVIGAICLTAACLICDYLWAKFGAFVVADIRYKLFEHIQGLSSDFFFRREGGDLLNCFQSDTSNVENSLVNAFSVGLLSMGTIGISGFFLCSLNTQLAVISYLGLLMCFLTPKWVNNQAMHKTYILRNQEGDLASNIQESITGQLTIKLFNLEQHFLERIKYKLFLLKQASVEANFLSYLSQRVPYLLFTLLNLAVLGYGTWMAYSGWLSLGELVSFQVLFLGLSSSISNLTWVLPTIVDGTASMQRIQDIFKEVPLIKNPSHAKKVGPLSYGIWFDNVSFNYPKDRPGLKRVSLKICRGERVVFVGPSGAGKSTILSLITRLYDPDLGTIFYDHVDIKQSDLYYLRHQISVISQNVVLFNTSIRENIRLGNLNASSEEIEAAAQASEIHQFILNLPEGYNTIIGEQGSFLSGGQRQRIALARALVRRSSILILDEATSALDPLSEACILATINQLPKNYTIISVTHRIAQAINADKIFVLDAGSIVEIGSHTELVSQNGLYASLWHQSYQALEESMGKLMT